MAASVVRSSIVMNPTHSTARSVAYTPATPARISWSVWKAFDVVSASCGCSLRSLQLGPTTINAGASNSMPTRRIDFVAVLIIGIKSLWIGSPLELRACADRERARRRIRQVVDATRGQAEVDVDLWIVARVFREEREVVAR